MSAIGWAVRRLLGSLARDAPLIVVFEDLHWAEPALLDLIAQIAGPDLSAPVLLLAVARPELLESRPGWAERGRVLELGALSDDEADALAEASPAAAVLAAPARADLLRRAAGNPFFLEQLLAAAAEDGAQGILGSALPPTVEALLADRLGRLFPAERASIERGAVIGEQFWDRAVAALATPAEQPSVGPTLASPGHQGPAAPGGVDPAGRRGPPLPAHPDPRRRLRGDPEVGPGRAARALRRLARGHPGRPRPGVPGDPGYHLERAHRLWTELGVDGEVPDRSRRRPPSTSATRGGAPPPAATSGPRPTSSGAPRTSSRISTLAASSSSSSSGCRWPTPGARRRSSTRPCARRRPAGTRGSGGGLSSAWPRSSAGPARTRTSPRWRT